LLTAASAQSILAVEANASASLHWRFDFISAVFGECFEIFFSLFKVKFRLDLFSTHHLNKAKRP
jgi:hypothetical protein